MYLPSFPNLMSEIEAIISVKKDFELGASIPSNLHEHLLLAIKSMFEIKFNRSDMLFGVSSKSDLPARTNALKRISKID